ncbi:MAG: hypothetical protein FWD53_12350 [Phycisphaerales bacterium]|nr:hypothetical protein [Phycisphaerales bacterium]
MADDQVGEQSGESALPRSRVLNYMSVIDSPTRVRVLTGKVLWILGWLAVGAAGLAFIGGLISLWGAWQHYDSLVASYARYSLSPPTFFDFLWRGANGEPVVVFAAMFLVYSAIAATCLSCSQPVKRGNRACCYMCMMVLVPSILVWILVAAGVGASLVVSGIDGELLRYPWLFLLLIPVLVALLAVLLLWDLICFLSWIAKHPVTEKPPVAFLPKKTELQS